MFEENQSVGPLIFRMSELGSVSSRGSVLFLWILVLTLVTSGFPQSPLPVRRASEDPVEDQQNRAVLFPSIRLHDWSVHMMSAPDPEAGAESETGLMRQDWLFGPDGTGTRTGEGPWWWSQGGRPSKRNMVVADDAAFREKSKLLTAMERQKWLNSYMQKLLVVNSS